MKAKLTLLVIAATLPLALPVAAHFPPSPNFNCNDGTDGNGGTIPHDFVGATSATVTTGITGEFGGGITIVFDGSLLPCGTEDLCPPGTPFITIDPSGDDLPDGTDPSGDNIVIWCDDILVGGTQVPIGDGEFEFGLSGAFLPDTHHNPLVNGYTVQADLVDGGFIFGSDEDNDGDVEEGTECFESHGSQGYYSTACDAGADGGWWFFTKCNVTTLSDWTFTTNGPLLRLGLGDDDGDGVPNSLEDDDSDGVPNGADSDNPADDFVNANWNPTLTPGGADASASCEIIGHINDDIDPRLACSDGVDNDGDGRTDWPSDPGCESPADENEGDDPQCSDGIDNDGNGFADWPLDPGCDSPRDNEESSAPRDFRPVGGITIHQFPKDDNRVPEGVSTDPPIVWVLPPTLGPNAWTCTKSVAGVTSPAFLHDALPNSGDYVECTPPPPPPTTRNVCTEVTASGYAKTLGTGTVTGTASCDANVEASVTYDPPAEFSVRAADTGYVVSPALKCKVEWTGETDTDDWWFHCGMNGG